MERRQLFRPQACASRSLSADDQHGQRNGHCLVGHCAGRWAGMHFCPVQVCTGFSCSGRAQFWPSHSTIAWSEGAVVAHALRRGPNVAGRSKNRKGQQRHHDTVPHDPSHFCCRFPSIGKPSHRIINGMRKVWRFSHWLPGHRYNCPRGVMRPPSILPAPCPAWFRADRLAGRALATFPPVSRHSRLTA